MNSSGGPSGYNNMRVDWHRFCQAHKIVIEQNGQVSKKLVEEIDKLAKKLLAGQLHVFLAVENTHTYTDRIKTILGNYDQIFEAVSKAGVFPVKSKTVLLLEILEQTIDKKELGANAIFKELPQDLQAAINEKCQDILEKNFSEVLKTLEENKDDLIPILQFFRNQQASSKATGSKAATSHIVSSPPTAQALAKASSQPQASSDAENIIQSLVEMVNAAPQAAASTQNQVVAKAHIEVLMQRWGQNQKTCDPKALTEMREIISYLTDRPELCSAYTVANNKSLDMTYLEDKFIVKVIDLIMENKLPTYTKENIPQLLRQIVDPKIRSEANQLTRLSKAERQVLRQTSQIIRNPSCNCFLGASLASILDNPPYYNYIKTALSSLQDNSTNPTIQRGPEELIQACQNHPLDPDYGKWPIDNDSDKKATFVRMTIKDAAKCALGLIEKRNSGFELNNDESNLLRLCFLKLMNRSYNPKTPQKLPHINDQEASIFSQKPEDAQHFILNLLGGLSDLVPELEIHNPFKGFEEVIDTSAANVRGKDAKGMPIYGEKVKLKQSGIVTNINLVQKEGSSKREPHLSLIQKICDGTSPPQDLNLSIVSDGFSGDLTSLCSFLESKNYDLKSFVVRKSMTRADGSYARNSGHFITYKKEKGPGGDIVWLCYDDVNDPSVQVVKQQEVGAVLKGDEKGLAPHTFVFSKKNSSQSSTEPANVTRLSAGQPEAVAASFSEERSVTRQDVKALIKLNNLDQAMKEAAKISNPKERLASLKDVLQVVSKTIAKKEQLSIPDDDLTRLEAINSLLTKQINKLMHTISRSIKPLTRLDKPQSLAQKIDRFLSSLFNRSGSRKTQANSTLSGRIRQQSAAVPTDRKTQALFHAQVKQKVQAFIAKIKELIGKKDYLNVLNMVENMPMSRLKVQALGYLALIRYFLPDTVIDIEFIDKIDTAIKNTFNEDDKALLRKLMENKTPEKLYALALQEPKGDPLIELLKQELKRIVKPKK